MAKTPIIGIVLLAICRAQAPQQASVSRVTGQVTSVTGEPVKNATVRLLAINQAASRVQPPVINSYSTSSDAAGDFAFESVPPGEYQVSAEHNGYLRRAERSASSVLIELVAGQPVAGVSLTLTPEARIEGTITNEDGDPVPEARVFVLNWTASSGFKRLAMQRNFNISSAADGTFVVGDLTEGLYYVCADVDRGRDEPRGRLAHEATVTTYYPDVVDVSAATLIKVSAGAVMRGVSIRMQRAAVYRFRGRAIDGATNTPATGMSITLLRESLSRISPRVTKTQDDGSFELNALAPGMYLVQAGSVQAQRGARPTRVFAPQITIVNKDVEDAILRLNPTVEVDWRVTVEGGGAHKSESNLGVVVSLVSGGLFTSGETQGGPDNTFVTRNLEPTKYVPSVAIITPGMYLKAMRFGGHDVTGKFIDLTSGVGGTLESVLSPHAADLGGVVRDPKGNPLPQIQVSLWKPGQRFVDGSFIPLDTLADSSGTFHFANLAPGEYRVAAWDGVGTVSTPEFLSQFDDAAVVVKVEEDAHLAVEAPLIKQDAIESAIGNLR